MQIMVTDMTIFFSFVNEKCYFFPNVTLTRNGIFILHKMPKLPIFFKMSTEKPNLVCILFQFNCCGVHSSEDFSQATEFLKYARDEGEGQIIPEACCMLDDFPNNGQLFTPKDVNCISTPTTSNSYMSRVRE